MKIALVGGHHRTVLQAPYGDPSWIVWACGAKHRTEQPRCDASFEIHGIEHLETNHPEYLEWLKTQSPVYMQRVFTEVPGSVAYPRDEMVAAFGPYFFTSSLAWMLASAISKMPAAIGFWGFEQAEANEYSLQRPATHYFAQIAMARGIRIVLPKDCGLLKPPKLYGWLVQPPHPAIERC